MKDLRNLNDVLAPNTKDTRPDQIQSNSGQEPRKIPFSGSDVTTFKYDDRPIDKGGNLVWRNGSMTSEVRFNNPEKTKGYLVVKGLRTADGREYDWRCGVETDGPHAHQVRMDYSQIHMGTYRWNADQILIAQHNPDGTDAFYIAPLPKTDIPLFMEDVQKTGKFLEYTGGGKPILMKKQCENLVGDYNTMLMGTDIMTPKVGT